VAESNFGGAMVESTIRTAPVKLLNASRGKVQRAEPVAALYAQGKVRHVGHFPELERQQCLFSTGGYMGPRSPDHADGASWGPWTNAEHGIWERPARATASAVERGSDEGLADTGRSRRSTSCLPRVFVHACADR
jgi:phage terminase large subunit-like protein